MLNYPAVLNIGTPKIINFPFGTNGKLMILGVPILKRFKVSNNSMYMGPIIFYREIESVCYEVDELAPELIDKVKYVLHGDFSQLQDLKRQSGEWAHKVSFSRSPVILAF